MPPPPPPVPPSFSSSSGPHAQSARATPTASRRMVESLPAREASSPAQCAHSGCVQLCIQSVKMNRHPMAQALILVSDDDPLLVKMLCERFIKAGFNVLADTDSQAYELARKYRPHLV